MARQPSRCSNVQNRSPWQVEVRNKQQCNQRFPFNPKADAQAYRELLTTEGIKAQFVQLATSFQLRVRRQGARVQVITFDTAEQAKQARLKIESELSVSIIRDYASAAQTTLRDLMERYRDDVDRLQNRAYRGRCGG
ncbi:SPOR domain-containing protein [Dechloromonas sp. A34]|uniref:SPOR domain-containing protein n=1 Tax=Dechloromonas sp. A34 TaxID=447588 RepID=UPI002248A193|nr:SPOR domain-containing protein [Dechloromonas sp. A34]